MARPLRANSAAGDNRTAGLTPAVTQESRSDAAATSPDCRAINRQVYRALDGKAPAEYFSALATETTTGLICLEHGQKLDQDGIPLASWPIRKLPASGSAYGQVPLVMHRD